MFIPTQEQRYSKRSLVTLVLCVIAPSAVYAYVVSDKMPFPVDSILGLANMVFFFAYPLAFALQCLGLPLYWVCMPLSILIHAGLIALIYTRPDWSGKKMISLSMLIGMLDLFVLKAINSIPG